jgi:polysaccharide biosynthesis transport protein
MNAKDGTQTLGLEQTLGILRRRAPLIVLCLLLVAGSAFAFSKQQTKKYTATASLVFNNDQLNQQVAGLSAVNSTSQQSQQSTNVKLVELGNTASRTARIVGQGLTGAQVKEDLDISAQGESNIVDVSATATSPALAAEIANTYAAQFVASQQNANHRYFSSALALVNKQLASLSPQQRVGPEGLALQDRAQSLAILAELQSGNVQIAQSASVPTTPSSPKVLRNTILGGVLGLLLGLALAFLLERLDRRIKQPDDLEQIFKLPLLAMIPDSSAYEQHTSHPRRGAPAPLPAREVEVFRMLRARLRYFNVDRDLRLMLVTSAASADGKTTVVQNLAEAAASTGGRVLIIEADLRRPSIAGRLSLNRGPGLAEVLIYGSTIEDAIQVVEVASASAASGAASSALSVLTAGTPPPNPVELIESHAMERVLEWAEKSYDLVLIDTPPLSVVPDAIPLLHRVHGVVIVSRLGKSTRDGAVRMREELASLGAPMLGVVANGFKTRDSPGYRYDYYYAPGAGYGSNGKQSAPVEPARSGTPGAGS